jgi:hypothetical protein
MKSKLIKNLVIFFIQFQQNNFMNKLINKLNIVVIVSRLKGL